MATVCLQNISTNKAKTSVIPLFDVFLHGQFVSDNIIMIQGHSQNQRSILR